MRRISEVQLRQWHISRFRGLFSNNDRVVINHDILIALNLSTATTLWSHEEEERHLYLALQGARDVALQGDEEPVINQVLEALSFDELVEFGKEGTWCCVALLKRDKEYVIVMYVPDENHDYFAWSLISEAQLRQLHDEFTPVPTE